MSPHAWLCAYYATLKERPFFAQIAPDLRAKALADLVEADYPARAAEIRGWNLATRDAMLAVLDTETAVKPMRRETELWRARNGAREVRCVAVYMPTGVDLRVLEGADSWRTRIIREPWSVRAQSDRWRAEIAAAGWAVEMASAT